MTLKIGLDIMCVLKCIKKISGFILLEIGPKNELKVFFALLLIGIFFGLLLSVMRIPIFFVKKGKSFVKLLIDAAFAVIMFIYLPQILERINSGRIEWYVFPSIGLGFAAVVVFVGKALDRICGVVYNVYKNSKKGVHND